MTIEVSHLIVPALEGQMEIDVLRTDGKYWKWNLWHGRDSEIPAPAMQESKFGPAFFHPLGSPKRGVRRSEPNVSTLGRASGGRSPEGTAESCGRQPSLRDLFQSGSGSQR